MIARFRHEAAVFMLAWQFLTRLPARKAAFTPERMAAAPRYFPAVGLVLGGLGAAVLLGAAAFLPLPVAVLLSIAAISAATGALHEDGLADSADGLGAATRQRALQIMKDGGIGAYGMLALLFVLATKAAALASMPAGLAAAALVAGHCVSRLSSVVVIATSRYAREAGTGGFTAGGLRPGGVGVAMLFGCLSLAGLAASAGGGSALAALGGCIAGHLLARAVWEGRLGGYTGDTLGATQQLSEVGAYLGVLAWA
jgi:adenosylcobinamide-GDP ribazoletransferase